MANKILVAYFSASGVTERAAKSVARAAKGDLFEIEPQVPYTAADLDWTDKQSRSSVEMRDPSCRPAIANAVEDMGSYDAVFVGFPIRWYTAPSIVSTFLESYDFSGKTVIPFATSGGSGLGNTMQTLQTLCPSAKWIQGKLVNNLSDIDLDAWMQKTLASI